MTVIEGNKDESEKCIEVACREIKTGNLERAEKFLKKAETLYPSNKAKILLTQLQAGAFAANANGGAKEDAESVPRRRPTAPKPEEPKLDVDYTSLQLEMVTKLKK